MDKSNFVVGLTPEQIVQPEQKGTLERIVPKAVGAAVLFGTLASPAFATGEPFDVTSILLVITGAVAVISSIGLAVLSLVVTGKTFKWAKTAL